MTVERSTGGGTWERQNPRLLLFDVCVGIHVEAAIVVNLHPSLTLHDDAARSRRLCEFERHAAQAIPIRLAPLDPVNANLVGSLDDSSGHFGGALDQQSERAIRHFLDRDRLQLVLTACTENGRTRYEHDRRGQRPPHALTVAAPDAPAASAPPTSSAELSADRYVTRRRPIRHSGAVRRPGRSCLAMARRLALYGRCQSERRMG
jgi:hypothetical protein